MESPKAKQIEKIGEGNQAPKIKKMETTCSSLSLSMLRQAVLDFCCTDLPGTVTIVDLGCSSGPNAFYAVSKIVNVMYKRCCELGRSEPEFRVFLNDLPGNDFNTIFQSLPAFQEKLQEGNGPKFEPLYVAGVPGSFYGRLFPSKTLHFVHSSSSLHWLSQRTSTNKQREDFHIKDKSISRDRFLCNSVPKRFLFISQATLKRNSSERAHGLDIKGQKNPGSYTRRKLSTVGLPRSGISGFG
ncbi:hypothetical protein V6N12_007861 [Hibiscus sabdariffa]|uniref:Uncharacterized protein n=1 Tax=Hibiscus sabdariffa TaxID=183260 RepID=A0ABR2F301_9ROSI